MMSYRYPKVRATRIERGGPNSYMIFGAPDARVGPGDERLLALQGPRNRPLRRYGRHGMSPVGEAPPVRLVSLDRL
jgi:hypothetical protein